MNLFEVAHLLECHIRDYKIRSSEVLDIIDSLYDNPNIPEEVFYKGPAFRLIFLKEYENIQNCQNRNQSWTIKNGSNMQAFIEEFKTDLCEDSEKLVCIDGDVFGINVNNLIHFLSQEGISVSKKFLEEDEVLAFESKIVSAEEV